MITQREVACRALRSAHRIEREKTKSRLRYVLALFALAALWIVTY